MRGDKVYLVHDMKRELIVMSKEDGSVRHIKLPVDSIVGGFMHNNYIVLRSDEVKNKEYEIQLRAEFLQL